MTVLLVDVQAQAAAEIADERYREAVDACKEILRARRWWHVLFPYKFIIVRRET